MRQAASVPGPAQQGPCTFPGWGFPREPGEPSFLLLSELAEVREEGGHRFSAAPPILSFSPPLALGLAASQAVAYRSCADGTAEA